MKDSVERTSYILKEARAKFKNPCQLWSTGKDSTLLLYLVKQEFGKVPWPVIHIDTAKHFREVYEFRDRIKAEWDLDLIVAKHPKAEEMSPDKVGRFNCCHLLKTITLRKTIEEHGFDTVIVAIRRDEHGIRNKERYFSPRDEGFKWNYKDQPLELPGWDIYFTDFKDAHHVRVHPILHWSLRDVWEFTIKNKIPINPLYLKGYTSLGCEPCTKPTLPPVRNMDEYLSELKRIKPDERSGRASDKERDLIMQRLRALGYM